MPGLSLDQIKDNEDLKPVYEQVEVAEFGADDEGDPYYVNIRGLTVYEWNQILKNAFDVGSARNGKLPELRGDCDEICQVAGMVSYDDDHRLVFGTDWIEAQARLQLMPRRYRPALMRIHKKALELTGFNDQLEETIESNKKKSRKTR